MSARLRIVVAAVVAVAGLAGIGIWWFFSGDEPAPVSLSAAKESVTTTDGEDGANGSTTSAPAAQGLAGTWSVDTETGDFDFESATGSFAGFRIKEELTAIGSTTAVGRTGEVAGALTIEGTTLTAASFSVDLATITTNDSRRDKRVQGALETDEFPTATWALSAPIELGAAADTGGPLQVDAPGTLTAHGVTRPVTFAIEAELVDQTIVVVGSTTIVFSDYGVEVPSSPIVLSAEDHGVIEVQLLFTRA